MKELPTHFLLVDKTKKSQQAKRFCEVITALRIVDVSDEPRSAGLPRPRLITPEGRFTNLDQIRAYTGSYPMGDPS